MCCVEGVVTANSKNINTGSHRVLMKDSRRKRRPSIYVDDEPITKTYDAGDVFGVKASIRLSQNGRIGYSKQHADLLITQFHNDGDLANPNRLEDLMQDLHNIQEDRGLEANHVLSTQRATCHSFEEFVPSIYRDATRRVHESKDDFVKPPQDQPTKPMQTVLNYR
jgi:hypothetical protein